MTKRKTLRSRCASDTCGRQFRHADPSAATCSPACRQRVSRISRKAEQEKREHAEKYERMAAAVGKRDALEEAERQAAERERHAAARQAEEERRRSQRFVHITSMIEWLEDKAFGAPSPDEFVDRWEDAGHCAPRPTPEWCDDLRNCPDHTRARYN